MLEYTTEDLNPCPQCGGGHTMIFNTKKDKWYICCGYSIRCGHKTKEYVELRDAANEWGLKQRSKPV